MRNELYNNLSFECDFYHKTDQTFGLYEYGTVYSKAALEMSDFQLFDMLKKKCHSCIVSDVYCIVRKQCVLI